MSKNIEEVKDKIRHLLELIEEGNLYVFLGAGASKVAGLPTMKELAEILERKITGSKEDDVSSFLKEIISILKSEHPEGVTIEQILEMVYHIYFLTSKRSNKISVNLEGIEKIDENILTHSLKFIKKIVHDNCFSIGFKLETYMDFFECLLRSGRLRKLDIFTTNWDILVEKVCDKLKIKCVDGFIGIFDAFEKFDIFEESSSLSSTIPTIHLYKLHGSLNWVLPSENEKIIRLTNLNNSDVSQQVMIYPTPSKFKEILGYPYADLISRFSDSLLKKEHRPLLLVIGYSFVDSHIATKVTSMLRDNEHSNLFIIDPFLDQEKISNSLRIDVEKEPKINLLNIKFEEFVNFLKELGKGE